MRYSAGEKYEIIRLVEESSLSVKLTLIRLGIRRSTFYGWLKRYQTGGMDALADRKPAPRLSITYIDHWVETLTSGHFDWLYYRCGVLYSACMPVN